MTAIASQPGLRSEGALVLGLAALACAVALVAGDGLRFHDEREYVELARNLLAHGTLSADGITPTAFRPPAWPLMLAGILALTPALWVAKLANLLCLVATSWLSLRLARRLGAGEGAARLVALAVFLYPLGLATAATLYPQAVSGLLVVACLHLCLSPGLLPAFGLGALSGVAALSAPGLALVLPALALAQVRLVAGRAVPRLAACALGFGLVLAPWIARNAAELHAFVPLSTSSGLNLLLGNSPNAGPGTGVGADISGYLAAVKDLGEVDADRALRREAVAWIVQNPGAASWLYVRKFANWFAHINTFATDGEGGAARATIAFVSYYGLLAAAVAGTILWTEGAAGPVLLWGLYLLAGLAHAVVFTRVRFRVPFDPILAVLAWPAFAAALNWMPRLRSRFGGQPAAATRS